jgi:hypothetical protein
MGELLTCSYSLEEGFMDDSDEEVDIPARSR